MKMCRLLVLAVVALLLSRDSLNAAEKPVKTFPLDVLTRILAESDDVAVQRDVLRGMHEALQGRRSVRAPERWPAVYRKLADSKDAEIREKVLQLSVLFGDPQALAALRRTASDAKAEAAKRRTALQTLIEKGSDDLLPLLRKLVADEAVRGTALRGLAAYNDLQTPQIILEQYPRFSPADKADAIATLASRPSYALALLDAMEKGRVPRRDLSAFTVRQLLAFKDKNLSERLTKVWGSIRPPSAEKAQLLAKYKALVPPDALKKADRKQGRVLFTRTCAVCHTLFGEGGKIGPDLTGSQRANPEYLLTKLLDPSAVVARDYQMTVVTTKSGRTISGLVKEENDKTLTVQTQNEIVRVDKADIEERQRSQQSMMPDGLLQTLSNAEVRHLIAYLSGVGQVPLPPAAPTNEKSNTAIRLRSFSFLLYARIIEREKKRRRTVDNAAIVRKLNDYATYLEGEDTNVYRIRAYRQAAATVLALPRPLAELLEEKGRAGLEELPGIGDSLAYTLEGLIRTGEFRTLKPEAGHIDPERLLTSLPGVGRQLAHTLHEQLGITTLEELERAAHEGRLAKVGVGPKRLRGLIDALAGRLRRNRLPEPIHGEPSVAVLLAIDEEYRRRADEETMPRLAPRRFNSEHEPWLPLFVADRDGWRCRALFSNTALAHRLGKTHDWVVVSFHDGFNSSQRTIVTETRGDLRGLRVVRGRERECRAYYEEHAPTPTGPGSAA